jgi:ferredoxin
MTVDVSRRQVLQAAGSAAAAGLLAGGAALASRSAAARPVQAIRPPGALVEDRFLAACVRCGLCVRDCPPQNLKLSRGTGVDAGVAIGTPFFVARDIRARCARTHKMVRKIQASNDKHQEAFNAGLTCIDCHKGIAHTLPTIEQNIGAPKAPAIDGRGNPATDVTSR